MLEIPSILFNLRDFSDFTVNSVISINLIAKKNSFSVLLKRTKWQWRKLPIRNKNLKILTSQSELSDICESKNWPFRLLIAQSTCLLCGYCKARVMSFKSSILIYFFVNLIGFTIKPVAKWFPWYMYYFAWKFFLFINCKACLV